MLPAVRFSRSRRALLHAVHSLGWLSHARMPYCSCAYWGTLQQGRCHPWDADEDDLSMGMGAYGEGVGASNIDYGGGSAASKQARKVSSARRKPKKGRRSQAEVGDAHGNGISLFYELTMAPLAQAFKDGESKPPAGAICIVLVFTPVALQHLLGGPISYRAGGFPLRWV
jgi:hypothetical protein